MLFANSIIQYTCERPYGNSKILSAYQKRWEFNRALSIRTSDMFG